MVRVARAFVYVVAALLTLLALAIGLVETGWAKNRIRALLVLQANQYLTATLTIGRLEGSLVRGLELADIDLSRDGRSLIRIDDIALSYSLRELFQSGTVIRRIRLTRPRIVAARLPDGRWDLGALIKRERREEQRTGPARPIEIQSVEIIDGDVSLQDPLDFGAVHLPAEFASLRASFSFAYHPVRWRIAFNNISWVGRAPELTVTRLSGAFGIGPGGWFFDRFAVRTPRSSFVLDGRILRDDHPAELDLTVHAERFAFQEWSGILRGLKNIAVEASFDTSLRGPAARLDTDLRLSGTGGSIAGHLRLDTTVPGWHGSGTLDLAGLDLARWLNRSDRPSDITGRVAFDLAFGFGRHFPRGTYSFGGPHAMYMGYAADRLTARGQITSNAVLVAVADATAYGAHVTTSNGSIGLDDPFPYHFQGTVTNIDLRNVPATLPVPRVESRLTFDYDASGRFARPVITGRALFAQSEFLGMSIKPGTEGTIDTVQQPLHFTGDGEIGNVGLRRLGEGLEVAWMRDPRYDGVVSGRFRVDGSGSDRETLALSADGHLTRAELFHGTFSDAEVSLWIDHGSLGASYSGSFLNIDPAVVFADQRLNASLTGRGTITTSVRNLLERQTSIADYDISGSLDLQQSTVRGVALNEAAIDLALADSVMTITRLHAAGPAIDGGGSGTIALAGQSNDFTYDITRADLAGLTPVTGHAAAGIASTKGHIDGPWNAVHAAGDGSVDQLETSGIRALTFAGHYDLTIPSGVAANATARVDGRASFVTVFDQPIRDVRGTITAANGCIDLDLHLAEGTRSGSVAGAVLVQWDQRTAELLDLTVALGSMPWRLASGGRVAKLTWNDRGFEVTPITFVTGNDGARTQRIDVAGDWRSDGTGALSVKATGVFLDSLQTAFERPARYGGVLDLDATIYGTRERPLVKGTLSVTRGRVERVNYEKLAARIDYNDRRISIDLRLDQSPGVWITAVGSVPIALFSSSLPAEPIDVTVKSSGINLGLVEGITDVVRHVSGELQVDVRAVGTSRDPHFTGSVLVTAAGFQVVASGSTYKNARMAVTLAQDRVNVDALHIEDASGRPLDVRGSLGTHELQVGDLRIDVVANRFEIFHNEFGRMDIGTNLQIRGMFETPRLTGDVTIRSGDLNVDEILQRTVFQPYATEPVAIRQLDPVMALNQTLWERLGMDLALHIPNTLRLTGDNVQVSAGTPVGIGNINLRAVGDLYFYKDPGDRLYVTGALDSLRGTYAFQGRRFDVDPKSSIVFRGDVDPDVYVGVTRVITGVEVRVGLIGPIRQPELRLTSTPPLDESEILSLVVFNAPTNQLNATQQQDLIVRAGALAAGFIATPLVTALEEKVGLNVLEIEPGDFGQGAKVTVGEEIAPGLVARFSRQFGAEPYDEATVEYYLARILRLRATFSDAQSVSARSPFRRVERAGIDLLFFFSF